MRAISLFSGIGGFDLGFQRAGIETVLQVEQDPHCLKVLERHWPHVRRVTDVRAVGRGYGGNHVEGEPEPAPLHRADVESEWAGIDILYGGFPCQDLSVAGKRAGLGGERSGLWFEFHRVLSELRPRWAVIENVPGLLSSNGGRDLAVILLGLEELGYGWAYAVLDAQHFGVAQRRRRVFIVGCLGGERRAAQVLSLCESCGGNPEAGRAPGERTSGSLTPGTLRAGGVGAGNNPHVNGLVMAVRTANTGANGHGIADDVAHTIDGASGQAVASTLIGGSEGRGFRGDDGSATYVAAPLGSNATGGTRLDLDHDTYVPDIVGTLSDGAHHGGGLNGQDAYSGRIFVPPQPLQPWYHAEYADAKEANAGALLRVLRDEVGEEAFTEWGLGVSDSLQTAEVLRSEVHGRCLSCAAEDGNELGVGARVCEATGAGGAVLQLWRRFRQGCPPPRWEPSEQLARELDAHLSQLPLEGTQGAGLLLGLWRASEGPGLLREALSAVQEARRSAGGQSQPARAAGVRRLTPLEAERLQGFPDNFTEGQADSHRYRQLGNAVAVPVAEWIGHRIVALNRGAA